MSSTLLQKAQQALNEKTTKIIPENIRAGVTIFGVTGTYEGSEPESEIFSATAGQIINIDWTEISNTICLSCIFFIKPLRTVFATIMSSVGSGAPVVRRLNSSSIGVVLAVVLARDSAMMCFVGAIIRPRPFLCSTPEMRK